MTRNARLGLLGSWFIAGFEGSTHRRRDGRRLDLVAGTHHDRLARHDYARMRRVGITAARESLRWHLVEREPGRYDFSAEIPRILAARRAGVTVVWDLCHFGWPDHVDPFADDFVERYAAWAAAVGSVLGRLSPGPHWVAPQNEISFLAWAGGDVGVMNPFATARGPELKSRLAAAAIAGIDALRTTLPGVRFLHPEPLINVAADPARPHERAHAAQSTAAQFEAWDLLAGRREPELGGTEAQLDVIGVNYYPDNQWIDGSGALPIDHPDRVPLSAQLAELHRRYGRPIVISETGAEDHLRGPWLRMVQREVLAAVAAGVPVGGICLYPVVNHPGWEDDRHCHNGVWDYPGPRGGRRPHRPLLRQVARARLIQGERSVVPEPNVRPTSGGDRSRNLRTDRRVRPAPARRGGPPLRE